ncbi:MAG: hypothetical protein IJE43_18945 [Alphaproteobacteria bacterium]|nr:hypothetical protein [Alphaproteobacteria bacterium]
MLKVGDYLAVRDNIKKDKKRKKEHEVKKREDAIKRGVALEEVGSRDTVHFERLRMWVYYLLSSLQKDRGKIPNNIGNRMMITNNMYVTRHYLSSIIHVQSLGLKTPVTLQSELIRYLRKENCTAVVDVTLKQTPFPVQLEDSGLVSRINLWKTTSRSEDAPAHLKEMAARCLYTVQQVEQNVPLSKTRMYITVRAKTGTSLTLAEKLVCGYLRSIGAEYVQIVGDVGSTLEYISPISDAVDTDLKDIEAIVTSEQTLAELLPNTGSLNSKDGLFMAVNVKNGTLFKFDFKQITDARNLYVVARSGHGKTVIVLNMCCSAVEEGYAVCIQDIKGNEFTNFVKSTGGYIVPLRMYSSGYINSWRMHKNDTTDEYAENYFKQRVDFSKRQMLILSGLQDYELRNDLEELLDTFHDNMYTALGVSASNRNTWVNTDELNPYVVYDKLIRYLTPTVIAKYPVVSKKVLNTLKMYMSRDGSKSYIFKHEFDYASILRSNTISFDFGLLDESEELRDPVIFKLKFAYMSKLNAEFVAYKYSKGIKVFKVLEESQLVVKDTEVIQGYVKEFTLQRSHGQTTVLLGNSISALLDSPESRPIIENVTGLLIGNLEDGACKNVIERFNLDEYADIIEELNIEERYRNAFLFINYMEPHAALPVLKPIWNVDKKYKVFSPVAHNTNGIV